MNQPLHYVVREPKKASENPPLLILLHGYGSNEMDLFSFAEELPSELLIISVRAPYEMGYGGYAWYDITLDATNSKHSDLHQARTSLQSIAFLIKDLKAAHKPSKTFLLGFSQGAILSYAFSFLHPNEVQHVIALSGYLNEDLLPSALPNSIQTDYYISHGSVDQVIPVSMAQKAKPFLDKHDLQSVYSEYPVGHGVAPQNFFSFKTWIEKRL